MRDPAGKEVVLAADEVLMAAGLSPERSLRDALERDLPIPVYPAGDTKRPRKIYDAIHEGYTAALQI